MTTVARLEVRANPLLKHFKADDILTSSELIALIAKEGITEENARQIIRRNATGKDVWRSERLRLPKDERLFADARFARSAGFFRAVGEKLLHTNRSGFARCLHALGTREALHKIDVMRLLAVAPAAVATAQATVPKRLYEQELQALKEIGIEVVHKDTPLESIVVTGRRASASADELASRAAAAARIEGMLARILVERLRRQNLFAWNQVELPDSEIPYTPFNGQIFSAYSFSYLSPLVRWRAGNSRPTPCPVLIDAYHGLCLRSHVDSFLQRIERATIRGKSRLPTFGIIAAKDFDRDAWSTARKNGLMTVSFRQMFGDEALEAMVLIEELFRGITKDAPSATCGQFSDFARLLNTLKTNPVVTTLRSIGFEALVGLTLASKGYAEVQLGRIVPWQQTTRDVDVFGFQGDEVRVVECKAYHKKKPVTADEVDKFFTETVPALKKWLRDKRHFSTCTAEIWTAGPLGREAREKLHSLQSPKTDKWQMLKGEDVERLLPHAIKQRGTELLKTIAMEEHENANTDVE